MSTHTDHSDKDKSSHAGCEHGHEDSLLPQGVLVAAFSFGLAFTMVTISTVAAWSVRHEEKKFTGFGSLMRRAPYFSCALLLTLASYMAWQGWHGLAGHH